MNFKKLKFPHNGDAIFRFLRDTIVRYNLEGKVVSITTDNASNNISAIKKLENSLRLGHIHYGFVHYKCLAHIIDLGVRASMKELKSAISPLRTLIMSIRCSTKRNETLHDIQQNLIDQGEQTTDSTLELIEDVDHRWNSCLLMLERAFLMKEALDQIMITNKDLPTIDPIDWPFIEKIIQFLKPFHTASTRMCSEVDSSISVVSIIVPRLIEHCQKHESSSVLTVKNAAILLKNKLTNYASEIYKPIVNIASALDPRYKLIYMSTETSSIVLEKLKFLLELVRVPAGSQRIPLSENNLLSNGLEQDTENFDELEEYLKCRRENVKVNAYEYWSSTSKLYPKLSRIAQKILSIQATSVASERVFSVAGNVDTPARNRLADMSVESIVLLKSWMAYLALE